MVSDFTKRNADMKVGLLTDRLKCKTELELRQRIFVTHFQRILVSYCLFIPSTRIKDF